MHFAMINIPPTSTSSMFFISFPIAQKKSVHAVYLALILYMTVGGAAGGKH